jgi:predicted metalloprotease with PDZ domain
MFCFRGRVVSVLAILSLCTLSSFAAGPNISIAVDATEAPRKIIHAKLRIPAAAGTLTLYSPKWIPGEHAPDGPVIDLTGLKFSAGGKPLTWRRDLKDGWTINVDVPAGQNEVLADLAYLEPANLVGGFSAGSSATDKLLILSWNQVVLYPKGWKSDDITYSASLRIPEGWKYATSLPVSNANGSDLHFSPVSLTMLVDSPVLTGQYLKAVPLTTGQPSAELDVAADSAAALEPPQEVWDRYKNLVAQAGVLFGTQHYQHYHFLYTLSDHVAHFGLEHHESDDSRVGERGLVDENDRKLDASLLPHEYVHSWDGKYRRPAGLATPPARCRCRMNCSGCMKALPNTWEASSLRAADFGRPINIASTWPKSPPISTIFPDAPGATCKTPPTPRPNSTLRRIPGTPGAAPPISTTKTH